jgi:hypothetical protein
MRVDTVISTDTFTDYCDTVVSHYEYYRTL